VDATPCCLCWLGRGLTVTDCDSLFIIVASMAGLLEPDTGAASTSSVVRHITPSQVSEVVDLVGRR
jgi:hypothetical protein